MRLKSTGISGCGNRKQKDHIPRCSRKNILLCYNNMRVPYFTRTLKTLRYFLTLTHTHTPVIMYMFVCRDNLIPSHNLECAKTSKSNPTLDGQLS